MAAKTYFLAVLFCGYFVSNASSQIKGNLETATVFVASTPCDSTIKTILQIPAATPCDFIRWELGLKGDTNANTFLLTFVFGEAQPNTLGFNGGGQTRSFQGTYAVLITGTGTPKTETYLLKAKENASTISLLKLDENLFHLLTPSGKLMIGNGGWSYTLNRKKPINPLAHLTAWMASSESMNEAVTQVTFDGRTPCQTFATEHQMNVSPACFKLKWRLILNRDPVNHEPTTYTIRKVVDNVPRDVSGRWRVIRGVQSNPDAVIYQLDPEKPKESISLLVGDENVLFFLKKDHKLYVGNGDFSFTLNRKQERKTIIKAK